MTSSGGIGACPDPETPTSRRAPASPFVGRARELAEIEALMDRVPADGEAGGAPAMCLVHGMGGVGRTALIRAAAARAGARFGDGRFEVNLHGFSPTDAPSAQNRGSAVRTDAAPSAKNEAVALLRAVGQVTEADAMGQVTEADLTQANQVTDRVLAAAGRWLRRGLIPRTTP
ncbi:MULTISPECIES: AAA family ATPase [unclassified Streptomyces]|uniref:AAA family ATPase n=1 Tax=unclassified Streptomyces TaxID=2593676 RepID=UPI0024E10CBC|nr:AAA family ATPase [Streptomyces sp. A 4/2]